jgi:diguanylate cyclase (GGDEF)-like protein/PAS domain S-box-containing protein
MTGDVTVPKKERERSAQGGPELRFLILEDAVADAELCEAELRRAGLRFKMRRVDTRAGFEAELQRSIPDLIISDFTFPGGFDGLAALEIARSTLPDVPFVFLSGTIGEDRAVEAIQRGAADYVLKDRMGRLGPAVRQVLERSRLLKEKNQAESALHASEERLRLFVEHAPAAIAMLDRDMKYLAVSRRWLADYQMGERDIVGLNHYEVFPELPERWKDIHRRCLAGAVEKSDEDTFPRADGHTDWVRWEIHPWRKDGGEIGGIILFSELITERKLQQQKIDRLSRIHALLSGINAAIVRAGNRQELLEASCRIAVEHGGFGIAWIGKVDAATLDVTPVAWAGIGRDHFTRRTSAREDVAGGRGVLGTAIRDRRPAWVGDLAANPSLGGQRREEALRRGYRSLIALPLFIGGEVAGSLSLFAQEPNYFNDEEVRLLEELAGNISFALESFAREEKIERLSRIRSVTSAINSAIVQVLAPQALFEEACRIAVEQGGLGCAWIGLLNRATLDIKPVACEGEGSDIISAIASSARDDPPRGQGPVGQAVRDRRAVFDNHLAGRKSSGPRRETVLKLGFNSMITLPLFGGSDVIGTFTLYAREPGYFDEGEIALLTELARNVSFALEHMARRQRIEKLLRLRAVSSEINAAIVRSHNKQLLFYEACRIAVEHGRFGIAWIGQFDPGRLEISPVASAGLEEDNFLTHNKLVIRHDTPQRQSLLAAAIRERCPTCNNDIVADAEVGGERRKEAIRRGYRSAIALPLIADGEVTHTFSLFVKEANFFDDEEVALLTELASNLSFALDNIVRQEKLDKLSRIRAISSGINAAIVRTREREALLREICRIASEQGKFEMIWIGTINHQKKEVRPVAWTGFSDEIAKRVSWKSFTTVKGTLGEAIQTRKPSVRNDIEAELPSGGMRGEALENGCRSTVCLPIVVDGEVVALISLFASGRGFFDQDELRIVDEIAPNISFALESIARQEKIERLSRIRLVLGEINGAISRTRDRQELFNEACRIAVEAGGLTFAWIGIIERNPLQVRPAAWAGVEDPMLSNNHDPRPLDQEEPGGPGPFAVAVLQKKAVVVNDVQNDARIRRKQDHLRRNINSIAILPLLVDGETAGVFGLHARETGYFDEEELKLLTELAADIALALQTIAKQAELDYLSYYDPLTGLPNRTLFIDRTGQQMRARSGEPRMVALILLNLDRFRYINETFGRSGGDALLKLAAQRLEAAFGGKDYLARIGADSFGIVIRGIRDASAVLHSVENLALGCFREPYQLDSHEVRVAAKAGIALFPADGPDADDLFRNAEAALKKAREAGERYLFYAADMNARAAHVLSLETRLRKAVEARQFVLHYQPKIELANDRICGLEALIRWQETGAELVPPASFIPLLEETGLILEVGKWALGQALSDYRQWTARGRKVPRIAVNVSAIQLQQKDFADMVINAVHEQGGNPESLELEVTESLLMRDVEASIHKLALLRGLGIHIAMDDFGTGYSSLSYIARLPINLVKIDRSFVSGMAKSPQDMAIVTTIIALAHSLNLRVVAEGVETESQSRLLKLLKCDEAQGYLFSKPLPATEIEALLSALA